MRMDHKIILHKLMDKYERSKLATGEQKRTIRIRFPFNKKTIPEYFNEANYRQIEQINEACRILEERGFVTIDWRIRDQYISAVELNVNQVDVVYDYLNRPRKHEHEQALIMLLSAYTDRSDFVGRFAQEMVARLNKHLSVKRYFDLSNIKDSEDLLTALCALVEQQEEILKRKFSVLLFKDSKRFERIENRVISIIREFSGEDFREDDDVLAEFNVLTNPSYVYMKGKGLFQCFKETIDLEKLGMEWVLNAKAVERLAILHLPVERVLTIENLTTFYEYEAKDELVIYLGGYHNRLRRALLKKIHQQYPNLLFYHWGDIDLGGIQIFHHLRKKTQIPVQPLFMDLQTLKRYEHDAQRIDNKSYMKKLTALLSDEQYHEFHEVIHYMVDHQIRLEQERIIIK